MIINHKYKFIFVHIPRTGGTSTREVLKKCDGSVGYSRRKKERGDIIGQHSPLTDYVEKLGLKNIDSYFKWTRVRNPWDRLVSIYSRRANTAKPHDAADHPAPQAVNNSFEDWVGLQMLDKAPYWRKQIFNQRRFIKDQGLDFVARFENINEDFVLFCDKVGLPQTKLPHLNGYRHNDYREYYNEKLIDKLLNYSTFREDLDYLGYDYQP